MKKFLKMRLLSEACFGMTTCFHISRKLRFPWSSYFIWWKQASDCSLSASRQRDLRVYCLKCRGKSSEKLPAFCPR